MPDMPDDTGAEPLPYIANPKQLAQFLGTTEGAIAQDRYLGRGIPYTRIGKRIRYLRADVLAYLAANRVGGDAS